MRKIIDSNQLRSESLRRYLAASKQNFAVLPDYVAMEAYGGDALVTILSSMEIVCQYPRQVIVLKGTKEIAALSGRTAGLQSRMIDDRQTRSFGTFARRLAMASRGDVGIQNQILDNGNAASQHLENMLATAAEVASVISPMMTGFSKEHRAEIRNWRITSQSLVSIIVKSVIEIAAEVYRLLAHSVTPPSARDLPNTLVFRAVLCSYLMVIERGAIGGGAPIRKVRNDMVDMYIAAYATFFDGILSNDNKLTRIHHQARMILTELFL
ncbi:hypothetical protein [Pseudomonas syringae]|uniref:hypothetical protein n=1 Tax=Pseudomonas syringae TaxID=317 RepID=UPI000515E027|nr:hypothetical protein [Pseudomonas syringae]